MSPKNPYGILGVSHSASTEEIKGAYRNLVKRYHPDLYPTYLQKVWANKKMQEINQAYAILRDPLRRDQYNKSQVTSEPVHPVRRARSAERPRPQPSTAQTVASLRRLKWSFYGGWFIVSVISFIVFVSGGIRSEHNGVNPFAYIMLAAGAFFVGLIGAGLIVIGLIVGSEAVSIFRKKLSQTPLHPWRDLAIRLVMLAAVVALVLYVAHRARVTPLWLAFVVPFAPPWGLIAPVGIGTILSEIVALVLYIYRARKVTETTEILLKD